MNSFRLRLAIAFCLFGVLPMVMLFSGVTLLKVKEPSHIFMAILVAGCFLSFAGWLVAGFGVRLLTGLETEVKRVIAGKSARLAEEGSFAEEKGLRRAFSNLLEARGRLEGQVNQHARRLAESQSLLRRSNGFLSATFDSSPDGILVVDREGRLITANRHFVERFGLSEEAITAHGGDLADAICRKFQDSELIRRRWDFYTSKLDLSAEEEWEVLAPDHSTYYVFTAPVTLDDNSPFARLWIFRDTTQQKNLEYGLQQAQKMEAVGRLAGGIAHDFNNLLTAISGNLALATLEDEGRSPGMHDRLASAQRATERAIELVKQLLGYSRKSHLIFARSNMNELVKEVRSILEHSLDPRITIQIDLHEGLWEVQVDTTQIQQVVINMCVNARDAMSENGGVITVATRNITLSDEDLESSGSLMQAGDFVVISVRDTGEGIPAPLWDRIFEPFFTTKDPGAGTGLGLAMSFGIIRQHDGWIDFTSEIDEGTEFLIYLPKRVSLPARQMELLTGPSDEIAGSQGGVGIDDERVLVQYENGNNPSAAAQTGAGAPVPALAGPGKGGVGAGYTVLIVDDEDSVRAIGEGVLRHHGFDVISACDGVQALERVAEYGDQISAIMLDLTMPNLSGTDTFKCLNEVGSEIPVLICSGFLLDLDEFSHETGGHPSGFLQKPYKIERLVSEVRGVIANGNKTPFSPFWKSGENAMTEAPEADYG